MTKIKIVSIPDGASGTLRISGTPITGALEITAGNLGNLAFETVANANGDVPFDRIAHDSTARSSNTGTVTMQIQPINDRPFASPVYVTTPEDVTYAFTTGDWTGSYADLDNDPIYLIRVGVPNTGDLYDDGVLITSNTDILAEDIGNITYVPPQDYS